MRSSVLGDRLRTLSVFVLPFFAKRCPHYDLDLRFRYAVQILLLFYNYNLRVAYIRRRCVGGGCVSADYLLSFLNPNYCFSFDI